MLLSCKCLNVHLDVDADDAGLLNLNNLQLGDGLAQDVFFNQDIRQVLRLSKVTEMLPMLVHHRTIGNWSFGQCLNCSQHTHAIMTGAKGATLVLVNSALLTNPEIEALKKHISYSKVYKVMVYETTEAERRYDYLPAEVEKTLRVLKQKADDSIHVETINSEERIRFYSDQQAQLLEDFKDKARADHKTLMRVFLKHQPMQPSVQLQPSHSTGAVPRRSLNDANKLDEHVKASSLRKVPDDFDRIKTPSPQHKVLTIQDDAPSMRKQPLQKKNSLDTECLFDIEGMDDDEDSLVADTSDGEDNGIPIKQNRHARRQSEQDYSIAKSLPMNIPVYISALRPHLNDDSDEDVQSEKSKDIAASIQALARSVNGDTVFGDLPRPRCRTNIM